jgi:hypothetical protein
VNFGIVTVNYREISLEKQNGEWYNSLLRKGAVYDLVYAAMSGADEDKDPALRLFTDTRIKNIGPVVRIIPPPPHF